MRKEELLLKVVTDMRTLADSIEAVINYKPSDVSDGGNKKESKEVAKTEKAIVTLEQVRAVLAEKSHTVGNVKVRELLQKYGADKLSAINPNDYPALLSDAEVL